MLIILSFHLHLIVYRYFSVSEFCYISTINYALLSYVFFNIKPFTVRKSFLPFLVSEHFSSIKFSKSLHRGIFLSCIVPSFLSVPLPSRVNGRISIHDKSSCSYFHHIVQTVSGSIQPVWIPTVHSPAISRHA